jgi:two-component sensor histidine kinase
MDEAVYQCPDLTEEDIAILGRIEADSRIVADVSRADILVYCRLADEQAVVVAQASPHSVPPIYDESLCGEVTVAPDRPDVFDTLSSGSSTHSKQGVIAKGAPVVQEVEPVYGLDGRLIAAISIEKTMIERERHRHRSIRLRKALSRLQEMVLQGELQGLDTLSSFGEEDGMLLVDHRQRIRYASGIAANLYRRLGYMETLEKKDLSSLNTLDEALVKRLFQEMRCLEEESQERDRIWIRGVIPIFAPSDSLPLSRRLLRLPKISERVLAGALILIHDVTVARREEKEARIRAAMIQEIHHRVKNNLQTIASLLRLQARRADSRDVRHVLLDSVSRILSVAVVHEFLSEHESRAINVREVSRRIVEQFRHGVLSGTEGIRFEVHGPNLYLPTQQATACALIVNELLQNALEHGFSSSAQGEIAVELQDDADSVTLKVRNSGSGLPEGFDLERDSHLGLTIVQTLVRDDLRGHFALGNGQGVEATVSFPKLPTGGEREWSELG